MQRPTTILFPHKLPYKELDHDLTYASVLESNVAADWKKWEKGKGENEGGRGGEKRGRRERGERVGGEGWREEGCQCLKLVIWLPCI